MSGRVLRAPVLQSIARASVGSLDDGRGPRCRQWPASAVSPALAPAGPRANRPLPRDRRHPLEPVTAHPPQTPGLRYLCTYTHTYIYTQIQIHIHTRYHELSFALQATRWTTWLWCTNTRRRHQLGLVSTLLSRLSWCGCAGGSCACRRLASLVRLTSSPLLCLLRNDSLTNDLAQQSSPLC